MPHSVLLKKFYDESLDEVAPGVYHVTRKQLRGGDVKKMSTEEKMIARIKNVPSDYTYTEAKNLAKRFGYEEQNKGRTSGSRVLLYRKRDQRKILLHKPHPGDIMQQYAVKQYLTNLIEKTVILMGENILEYKGYYTKILYSVKDHVLYGKIEGIRDLVNFESESIENIEQEFHSAVDDYLAFCEDLGQNPEKAYKGVFNVRITPELHREAAIAADKNNETLNSFVANAISQAIHGNTPTVIYSFASDVTNAFKTIATTRKTRTAAYVGN